MGKNEFINYKKNMYEFDFKGFFDHYNNIDLVDFGMIVDLKPQSVKMAIKRGTLKRKQVELLKAAFGEKVDDFILKRIKF